MHDRTNSPVTEIKTRLSITDVLSSYIELIPSGVNYKAKCPFHNEKTPSFFISPVRNGYYCFGCGAKGDIFSFVENFEGVDFKGALKTLAERAGVPLVYTKQEGDNRTILYEIMDKASEYFENEFAKSNEARAYLLSRGVTDETIKSFRVGYARDGWRNLSDYLTKLGYHLKDLETVGLIKISEKGAYDRFRSRVMFPISDSSARVIAFSGRLFGAEESEVNAKYLNSPDTVLFNKSNVLFGIDKAKLDIRKRGYAVIVEGQMDLLLSHQMGCTNTVAVSGTALSSTVNDAENSINNLGLIRRLSSNIIFAFDGDSAGIRAAGRSALIALSLDMQVKIAVLPEGKDPADIIGADPNEWKKILTNAKHIITFYVDRICTENTDQKIRGRKIREVVFPYIRVLKSAIDQSAYLKEITLKTNIPESALSTDFEMYKKEQPTEVKIVEEIQLRNNKSRRSIIEARLFGIIFKQEEGNWSDETIKKVIDEFKDLVGLSTYDELVKGNSVLKDTLAMETEMWYGKEINMIARDVSELALNLAEDIYNEKAENILSMISQKDREKDKDEIESLLKQYQGIITHIHTIKSRRRE